MRSTRRIAETLTLKVDGLLAVALFLVGVSEVAFGFRDGGLGVALLGPPAAEVIVVAALTLPLAVRRRYPLPALATVAAAMAAQVLLLSASAPFAVGLVPLVILTFDVGRGDRSPAAWGLIIAAAALGVISELVARRSARLRPTEYARRGVA